MSSRQSAGVRRRAVLQMGSLLALASALPGRLWATVTRPQSAFEATAVEGVFADLGVTPARSDAIIFSVPDIAENGAVVPVKIEVDDEMLPNVSKVYVIVEKNPNPLAAVFAIPVGTQPYVETRVKVAQTCELFAVAEAEGQLYMASKETKVTLGGCGG